MSAPQAKAPSAEAGRGCSGSFIVAFGILLPIIAFMLDASMQIDPVLWGDMFAFGRGPRFQDPGARQVIVYLLLGVSLVGVAAAVHPERRSRAKNALAIGCLTVALFFAAIHALVFLPIAPVMVIAVLFGVGLIGLSPYFALIAWLMAYVHAVGDQAQLASRRWIVGPIVGGVAVVLLAAAPFVHAHATVEGMRRGGPRAITEGFRSLGSFAPLARNELVLLYFDLDGPSQVRFRNHYLEVFGSDPNEQRFGGRGRW